MFLLPCSRDSSYVTEPLIPEGRTELPLIACSLDSAQMDERRDLIKGTFRTFLQSTTRSARTLHLRFLNDPEALSALQHIIELESECCPFFSFDLSKADDSIFLAIGVPEGAESTLDEFDSLL